MGGCLDCLLAEENPTPNEPPIETAAEKVSECFCCSGVMSLL